VEDEVPGFRGRGRFGHAADDIDLEDPTRTFLDVDTALASVLLPHEAADRPVRRMTKEP
jgi:hypothetical protein